MQKQEKPNDLDHNISFRFYYNALLMSVLVTVIYQRRQLSIMISKYITFYRYDKNKYVIHRHVY